MPQFYYPQGRPVESTVITEFNEAIEKVFGKGQGKNIGKDEFAAVTTDIFKIPKIFSDMLFTRIEQKVGPNGLPKLSGSAKLNKQILQRLWD